MRMLGYLFNGVVPLILPTEDSPLATTFTIFVFEMTIKDISMYDRKIPFVKYGAACKTFPEL